MPIEDLPKNVASLVRYGVDELSAPVSLRIENGRMLWDELAEDIMDWMESMDHAGLDGMPLEHVTAEEINEGFTFRAVSKDGTEWESAPCDCHRYAHGEKVGRFPDSRGRLVIVTRR